MLARSRTGQLTFRPRPMRSISICRFAISLRISSNASHDGPVSRPGDAILAGEATVSSPSGIAGGRSRSVSTVLAAAADAARRCRGFDGVTNGCDRAGADTTRLTGASSPAAFFDPSSFLDLRPFSVAKFTALLSLSTRSVLPVRFCMSADVVPSLAHRQAMNGQDRLV